MSNKVCVGSLLGSECLLPGIGRSLYLLVQGGDLSHGSFSCFQEDKGGYLFCTGCFLR